MIKTKDEHEEKIKDLLEQWQRAEYSAYSVLKHGQTVEMLGMNDIMMKLASMKVQMKVTDEYFQENPERAQMKSPLIRNEISYAEMHKATRRGFD